MNSWLEVGSGSRGFEPWGHKGYIFHTSLISIKGILTSFFFLCIQYIIYTGVLISP